MPGDWPLDFLLAPLGATLGVLPPIAGAQRLIWLQLLALLHFLLDDCANDL